ncbi:hypothetical protein WUBG_13404 [Wuchereria bancrofti]|uniref:Uncharacterized protein n=1 Tax=Wuchereria bancrofti TaxID=6293 RepID=J9EK07_WUCBA|nr:hypothetical protein WUBG_13404 [Wuchereria bancrofti]
MKQFRRSVDFKLYKCSSETSITGTVRGCSSQFLTRDQHSQIGLGPHSRISQISNYLSSEFDMSIGVSAQLISAMKKVATTQIHIQNPRQSDVSTFSTSIFPPVLPINQL